MSGINQVHLFPPSVIQIPFSPVVSFACDVWFVYGFVLSRSRLSFYLHEIEGLN